MLSFSQKKGLKPIKSVLQTDSMDLDLRTALWNVLGIYYWDRFGRGFSSAFRSQESEEAIALCKTLWMWHFKLPVDLMRNDWIAVYKEIRTHFFAYSWNEVYDFIQFVAANFKLEYPNEHLNNAFIVACNGILKQELSTYRIVGEEIVQITSDEEIAEIEDVLRMTKNSPVQEHINTSLKHLSSRNNPDYRNSIKESISAVESISAIVSNKPNASLGDALKTLEPKIKLHPSLKIAFEKLYGYTSNADGIRHALLDEANLDFEDAKFMLVACSAFINYLISKSVKAGIKIKLS